MSRVTFKAMQRVTCSKLDLSTFVNQRQNTFLLNNHPAFGPHLRSCFCTTYRDRKLNALLSRRDVTLLMLHGVYLTSLARTQKEMLDLQFEFTKEEIIIGFSCNFWSFLFFFYSLLKLFFELC